MYLICISLPRLNARLLIITCTKKIMVYVVYYAEKQISKKVEQQEVNHEYKMENSRTDKESLKQIKKPISRTRKVGGQ